MIYAKIIHYLLLLFNWLQFFSKVCINESNHPVYVHCLDGRRIAGLVVLYLRRMQGWTPISAIAEYWRSVLQCVSSALPNLHQICYSSIFIEVNRYKGYLSNWNVELFFEQLEGIFCFDATFTLNRHGIEYFLKDRIRRSHSSFYN